jgi:hypothetical protein
MRGQYFGGLATGIIHKRRGRLSRTGHKVGEEADFQAWRDDRDWTAEKYRRFDRGERMPLTGNRNVEQTFTGRKARN